MTEGIDYMINEKGLLVFTAKYLQQRGFCCGNGCTHCPYDYKEVAEPLRSRLLQKRKDSGENE